MEYKPDPERVQLETTLRDLLFKAEFYLSLRDDATTKHVTRDMIKIVNEAWEKSQHLLYDIEPDEYLERFIKRYSDPLVSVITKC